MVCGGCMYFTPIHERSELTAQQRSKIRNSLSPVLPPFLGGKWKQKHPGNTHTKIKIQDGAT